MELDNIFKQTIINYINKIDNIDINKDNIIKIYKLNNIIDNIINKSYNINFNLLDNHLYLLKIIYFLKFKNHYNGDNSINDINKHFFINNTSKIIIKKSNLGIYEDEEEVDDNIKIDNVKIDVKKLDLAIDEDEEEVDDNIKIDNVKIDVKKPELGFEEDEEEIDDVKKEVKKPNLAIEEDEEEVDDVKKEVNKPDLGIYEDEEEIDDVKKEVKKPNLAIDEDEEEIDDVSSNNIRNEYEYYNEEEEVDDVKKEVKKFKLGINDEEEEVDDVSSNKIRNEYYNDEEEEVDEYFLIKARKDAEDKARKEAKEAEEKARKEAEEKARKEAEEKARKEAEEIARKEAEEKARKEAEDKARKEAEDKARKEAEDKAKLKAVKARLKIKEEEEEEEETFDIKTELLKKINNIEILFSHNIIIFFHKLFEIKKISDNTNPKINIIKYIDDNIDFINKEDIIYIKNDIEEYFKNNVKKLFDDYKKCMDIMKQMNIYYHIKNHNEKSFLNHETLNFVDFKKERDADNELFTKLLEIYNKTKNNYDITKIINENKELFENDQLNIKYKYNSYEYKTGHIKYAIHSLENKINNYIIITKKIADDDKKIADEKAKTEAENKKIDDIKIRIDETKNNVIKVKQNIKEKNILNIENMTDIIYEENLLQNAEDKQKKAIQTKQYIDSQKKIIIKEKNKLIEIKQKLDDDISYDIKTEIKQEIDNINKEIEEQLSNINISYINANDAENKATQYLNKIKKFYDTNSILLESLKHIFGKNHVKIIRFLINEKKSNKYMNNKIEPITYLNSNKQWEEIQKIIKNINNKEAENKSSNIFYINTNIKDTDIKTICLKLFDRRNGTPALTTIQENFFKLFDLININPP